MLTVSRAGVLGYLAEKNLAWREDSTNADIRFFRNRVRHCLIPLLDEMFPFWRRGLGAAVETQALAAGFIGAEARRRVHWVSGAGGVLRTGEARFFAQPAIIREEALFRGIDRLPALRGGNPAPVRRVVLRRFCAGGVTAADLGPARLRRPEGQVELSPGNGRAGERGFSLLIKVPGLYTLKGVTVEARPAAGSAGDNGQEGCFCAVPLVLRPAFSGDCVVTAGGKIALRDLAKHTEPRHRWCAVDRLGPAAFIGPRGLLAFREFTGGEACFRLTVKVSKAAVPKSGEWGTASKGRNCSNAQQSE
jgi:tRNA(Ile)-lysidine synthase